MTDTPGDKIVVRVDAELEDLIPGFIEGRHTDIETIKKCLEEADFDKIFMIGHSMKGNGAGYGFDDITDIGRIIENMAKARDSEGTRNAIQRLKTYLQSIEIVYED